MPNHCSNCLLVGASDDHRGELNAFHALVSTPVEKTHTNIHGETTTALVEGIALCDNILPCPKELSANSTLDEHPENLAKYGFSGWYDWCNFHWGTKWGDYNTDCIHEWGTPNLRAYRYTTAWSPMTRAIHQFSEKFPNLVFLSTYEEGGNAILGAECSINGESFGAEGVYPEVNWDEDEPGFEKVGEAQVICVRNVLHDALQLTGISFDETIFDSFFREMA